MQKNPLLENENYFQGYQKSIDELKNRPDILEFDRLCYELFETSEFGNKFMKIISERYLIPSLVNKGNPTYQVDVLWQEGFKDFARMLIGCARSHKQRIKAEGHN